MKHKTNTFTKGPIEIFLITLFYIPTTRTLNASGTARGASKLVTNSRACNRRVYMPMGREFAGEVGTLREVLQV